MGASLQDEVFPLVDAPLQLFQIDHVALEKPGEEKVQQLLVVHGRGGGQLLHGAMHVLLSGFVPAEEKQILAVNVHQHLAAFARLMHVVPVERHQVVILEGLEALRLVLPYILEHGGVHFVRHLRHIVPKQYRLHTITDPFKGSIPPCAARVKLTFPAAAGRIGEARHHSEKRKRINVDDMQRKKPEECAYSFNQHKACEFFPCHKTDHPEDFNCLFCYCPLYTLGSKCGGNFRYLENGVKDCSGCLLPHGRGSYSYVISKYPELMELAKKNW